jgi:hypothetical protein
MVEGQDLAEGEDDVVNSGENSGEEDQEDGLDYEVADTVDEDKPIVKFDLDSQSAITFNTDTSSYMRNPSTINTVASSKLELQLNFLAK